MTAGHAPTSSSNGPLCDLRVLDLSSGVAGAFCARLLAACGADVLAVDRDDGHMHQNVTSVAPTNQQLTRAARSLYLRACKRSLVLDCDGPDGQRQLSALIGEADVLVHDLPRAAFELLAGTEQRLLARFSRLIITAISPFGRDGPYGDYAGGELIEYALGGLLALSGPYARPPVVHGGEQSGYRGGIYAAAATLVALAERWRSGRGQLVEVALSECIAAEIGNIVDEYVSAGLIRRREPVDGPGVPEQGVMACRDGFITAVVGGHYDWDSFAAFMEIPELADPQFATAAGRIAHAPEMNALMRPRLLERTADEWFERAQLWRFIWGPVRDFPQILSCPHLRVREFFTTIEDATLGRVTVPGAPFRMSVSPLLPAIAEMRVAADGATWRPRNDDPQTRGWSGSPTDERPLAGLRVIDLGNWVTIPYLCRFLADLGAEVIKVESLHHLTVGRIRTGVGQNYVDMHRGKRSVTIELDRPQGVALFKRLIASADVLTENFAPRVLGNLGLGYETLRAVNPRLIHCSSTAFGQSGPYRDYGAFGSTLESMMGLAAITGFPEDPPTRCGTTYTDYPAAMMACVATMAALAHRRRTGEGQYIDLSQYETALSMMGAELAAYSVTGQQPPRRGNRSPDRAPQGVYRCAGKDNWLAISVETDAQFAALCEVIGHSELALDPRYADVSGRGEHHDALDVLIHSWTRAQNHRVAMRLLQARGVPTGAVLNPKELLLDQQMRARRFFQPWVPGVAPAAGVPTVSGGIPWRLSRTPAAVTSWVPPIGADNAHALHESLGLSSAEYNELIAAGVVTPEQMPSADSRSGPNPASSATESGGTDLPPELLVALGRISGHEPQHREIVASAYERELVPSPQPSLASDGP